MHVFRWKKLLAFLLLFGALGYLRENFFIYLNNILYVKLHPGEVISLPCVMQPFFNLSYDTLYLLKYPFTLLWTAIFFGANYWVLQSITGERFLLKLLVICYAAMLGLAALSITYSLIVHGQPEMDEYTWSRWLMGVAQSPLVGLILLAGARLVTMGEEKNHIDT